MQKKTLGIILLILLSIIIEVIFKFGDYNYFRGIGLIILIVYAVLLYAIMRIFVLKKVPKNEKEMKEFKWKGFFNPLFLVIVSTIQAILSAISLIFGPKTTYNIFATIVIWGVAIFFIFFWLYMRKLGLVGKKK